MALVRLNHLSMKLNGNVEVGIILPDVPFFFDPKKFYESGKKYKVLWLLHGTFGDYSDWIRKSMIELYATEKDLIVVMPSALNSVYENWPNMMLGYNMKDYFFDELMPMIYNWFPASDKKEDNFIAGLSMGGRGTMKFACSHPEKFAGAAILSSCPRDLKVEMEEFKDNPIMYNRMLNDIERCGGIEEYLKSDENTWDHCKDLAKDPECPKLYFCCGEDDMSINNFRRFEEYAKKIGLKATFETEAGYKHEWRFWDKYIQKALEFFEI
ncbi:MAG: hypothetical protein IKS54_06705 [Erysipelotrichaceae bacterium]|nr:hypothetical protein [Erysipelotrichaceae bacterium]